MKSNTLIKRLSTGALLLGTLLLPQAPLPAATTDPVGYTTIELAEASGSARGYTVVSFPLTDAPVFAGAVTSVGATTVTVTDANFPNYGPVNGFYTHVVIPHSGNGLGRSYTISSNDATTITLLLPEETDSLAGNIAEGDQIRIVPVNTLSKIFGAGATLHDNWDSAFSPNSADLVYIWDAAFGWTAYYYNSTYSRWNRQTPNPSVDYGATPIFPSDAVWVARRSTGEIKLVIDGSVPITASAKLPIYGPEAFSGQRVFTFVSTGFPKDILLNDFQTPTGWMNNNSPNSADLLYRWTEFGWTAYWKNNSGNWVTGTPFNSVGATTTLQSNSGIWIGRLSATTNENELYSSITRPFTP